MFSRISCSLGYYAGRRWLSKTPKVCSLVPQIISSDLLSEKGLIKHKVQEKKKNVFVPADHESTHPNFYGSVNIKVEGFDMVVVERFTQMIHRFVQKQKIKVKEVYGLPTAFLTVKHVGTELTTSPADMKTEADLPVHTRVVQVCDLKSTTATILIQSLIKDVPPGITLSMHEYKEEDYLKRHKVNKELIIAQEEFRKLRYGR